MIMSLYQSSYELKLAQTTTVTFSYVLPQTTEWTPCVIGEEGACIAMRSVTTVVRTITVSDNEMPTVTLSDVVSIIVLVGLIVAIAYLLHGRKGTYEIKGDFEWR
jgi:hypothetical protein